LAGLRGGVGARRALIAEAAAETAVKKTFIGMGLDPCKPLQAQRDFNFLRDLVHDDELKSDMGYLRRSRRRSEGVVGKAITTAVGLAVLGALHVLWEYVRALVAKLP
ncbi:MAG: hypothetical protein ACK4UO_06300, partial [Pseudolabrys sp.]